MRLPPPGRMVDLDAGRGGQLHMQVAGGADPCGPTVILEAGLAATSISWVLVQDEIASFARVVSYDRAGFGWSGNAAPQPLASAAVADLQRLLESAALPGPYILVGHSFGGLIVRLFQQLYPERVAALVLVDPVFRAEWRENTRQRKKMLATGASLSRRGAYLAKIGVVRFALNRLVRASSGKPGKLPGLVAKAFAGKATAIAYRLVGEISKIPRELWPVVAAQWSEEQSFLTMAAYIDHLAESCGQLDESRSLGDLPLVVLSAASASPAALAEHGHDCGLSTRGSHRIIHGTGHWMNLDAPDAVVSAVRYCVDGLR